MKIYSIIPARGGSKGVPNKNIINLAGKPLIAWSIEQAKNSKLINRVFVSTNDEEIANVSKDYGADVIMRPSELATDISPSEDALLHAINFIENKKGKYIDIVVFLQATSPVREKDDIDNAIRQYFTDKADSLFSCTKLKDYFIWEKEEDNCFSVNYDYHNRKPRQNVKPQYLENGSIYIFRPDLLRKNNNRLGGNISMYEMPYWKSFQVDEMDDLEICEYYIKKRLNKGKVQENEE